MNEEQKLGKANCETLQPVGTNPLPGLWKHTRLRGSNTLP